MTLPPANWDNYEEEGDLRTDISIAIKQALENKLDQKSREITRIEEEKLTYFAIQDLDLELSYSFYLAGGNTEVGVNQEPESPATSSQSFGPLTEETPTTDRIKRLREYFESNNFFGNYTLRKVWFTDRYEFLRDFYQEFAQDEYEDLYLISAEIREQLENIDQVIDRDSQNADLSDWGGGGSSGVLDPADERELRYLISDLHLELAAHEDLSKTKGVVASGTDLIEEVLFKLTQIETTSRKQRKSLNKLSEFFFFYVWKYPALLISADTASGPNADIIRANRLEEYQKFDKEVNNKKKRLTDEFYKCGLLPETADLEAIDVEGKII